MAINNSKKDIVLSNMDKIKEWIGNGVPMGSIAKNIGVSKSTLYKYIGESEQGLNSLDAIKKYRQPAVDKLEATMFKSACGFEHKVKKYAKLKRVLYDEMTGKKSSEYEELVEYEDVIYYPPDTTASIFLLKNWGGYMNEPATQELRKREIEPKERNNW